MFFPPHKLHYNWTNECSLANWSTKEILFINFVKSLSLPFPRPFFFSLSFFLSLSLPFIGLDKEHKCVLDSCRWLESEGFEVTYLPVQSNGLINLEDLENSIRLVIILSLYRINSFNGPPQKREWIRIILLQLDKKENAPQNDK